MSSLNTEIERFLTDSGASLVGFADITALPTDIRESMPYAIAIAVALDASIINRIKNGPTKEYFEEYKRANTLLAALAKRTAEFIKQKGFNAVALEPTLKKLPENLATALPHKMVATRAGLGWVGKSNLLITEKYGSAVRLVSVLTDAPIETAEPINESGCGQCNECVIHCPAGVLLGEHWRPGQDRGKIVNVYVCRETAVKLCKQAGFDATICGICINVCPWTQKYITNQSTKHN
jgi:epoxyqueuosine reductase QueG